MKIILFSRKQVAHSPEDMRELFKAIQTSGADYAVNEEFAAHLWELAGIQIPQEKQYAEKVSPITEQAMMVCYGGDGTLLEGVHRLGQQPIPVLGINAGHLGFLTGAPKTGFQQIIADIVAGNIRTEARSLLEVEGIFDGEKKSLLALNEFAIQRQGPGMIAVETIVDEQTVATYHGDGVILSTPTGSTAYALSAGGPIVAPTCSCMLISPLAPHNLSMRPLVIPDTCCVQMKIHPRRSDAFALLDNRTYALENDSTYVIRRAEHQILLALPHNISFYDTLRNKMMWGVDIRS